MIKKYNLLCPIAGEAQRFVEEGFLLPKPMIPCRGKTILEKSLEPFNLDEVNLIFVVLIKHIDEFKLNEFLRDKFGDEIKIRVLGQKTDGTLCTCIEAEDLIDPNIPLVICTPDITFEPKFELGVYDGYDGGIHTFWANSTNFSYARTDEFGNIFETKEKEVISENAASGLYFFNNSAVFFKYAKEMVANKDKTKNEYYICPLYNYLIRDGYRCKKFDTSKVFSFGTPQELRDYEYD